MDKYFFFVNKRFFIYVLTDSACHFSKKIIFYLLVNPDRGQFSWLSWYLLV